MIGLAGAGAGAGAGVGAGAGAGSAQLLKTRPVIRIIAKGINRNFFMVNLYLLYSVRIPHDADMDSWKFNKLFPISPPSIVRLFSFILASILLGMVTPSPQIQITSISFNFNPKLPEPQS